MKLTDPRFRYVSSVHTDITATLRKHGFKPTTEAERKARQEKLHEPPANVTPLRKRK